MQEPEAQHANTTSGKARYLRSYTNLSAGFAPIRFVVKSMYVGISARANGCNNSQKCLGYPPGRDVSFGVINMSKLVWFFILSKIFERGEGAQRGSVEWCEMRRWSMSKNRDIKQQLPPKWCPKTHVRGGGNQPLERLEEVGNCTKRYAGASGSIFSRPVTDTHTSVSHTKS